MTRVDEAVESIREMVINKEYGEDGFLPCEGDLSEKLGVSRATIREAVRTLEVRGFVKRIHGKGIGVVDQGADSLAQSLTDMMDKRNMDYKDVLEARWIIEANAAKLAVKRASDQEIAELKTLVLKLEKGTEITSDYLRTDLAFHKKLVESSKNEMLIAIVEAYSKVIFQLIDQSSNANQETEKVTHFHRAIYTALEQRDKKLIEEAIKKHLRSTADNIKCDLGIED